MGKITLPHRYTVLGKRFREAFIEAGWLCFRSGTVSVRLHLLKLARLERTYQMRDGLLAVAFVGFFVGLVSLLLRSLGWLNLPQLLRLSPAALEYGALALALVALAVYLFFPIRVLYLYDGSASPLAVVGSQKGLEAMEENLWNSLQTLRGPQP
ncbi:hypothetical protein [Meiothermus rufus]|uniref:hypothetical protein n=1 Tax=Meiothermus rufus TaxID=604332 RepID=UPI00041E21F7|nr:hypothetical protein [Meiothermus rufus]